MDIMDGNPKWKKSFCLNLPFYTNLQILTLVMRIFISSHNCGGFFFTFLIRFYEPYCSLFDQMLAVANFRKFFGPVIFPDLGVVRLQDVCVRLKRGCDKSLRNRTLNWNILKCKMVIETKESFSDWHHYIGEIIFIIICLTIGNGTRIP
jgi:hypothetical protein